ncbi:MAG: tetratricopeptide repeat protein, partial [Myxococcales bacterium]
SGLISASLLLVTLASYWPVLDDDFVYFDDTEYVIENPQVHRGLTPSTVIWAWTTDRMGTWHPLTWLSHAADWSLYGEDPHGHHLTSVLLHAFNAMLLFWVLRRMTGSIAPSAFVAFVFAVHPLNVASVAWIASRKGVLSTTFWFLTMWAYAAYTERGGVKRYLLVLVAFLLGLASKPMLITLPVVLWLLDVWPLRRMQWNGRAMGAERPVYEKLPMLLFAAVVAMVVLWVRRIGEPVPLAERLAQLPVAYVTYVLRIVWPTGLATPYPPWPPPSTPRVLGALLFLLAITAIALGSRRKRPFVLVGWLWFLVTLAPVIGIVQIGAHPMADRWAYVPMVGVLIAVAWGVGSLLPRSMAVRASVGALAVAAVLGLAVATQAQIGIWQNTETLFRHAIAVTQHNRTAHYNLAWYLAKTGRRQEAITEYRRALAIKPDDFPSRHNLALLLLEDGLTDEAVEATCAAIRLTKPKDEEIRKRLRERLKDKRCEGE